MAEDDLYRLLRVAPDAGVAEIRRAYQRLARRLHPDLHPGDARAERRFEEAARAWEVLSDPELRRRYDRGDFRPEGAGGSRAGRLGSLRGVSVSARIDELIDVVVARDEGRAEGAGAVEEVLEADLTLDFAEAVRGTTTSLSVQREKVCPACRGGPGRRGCVPCASRGQVVELERIRVRIPPGVDNASRVRLRGRGRERADGERGDLYVSIRVRAHPYFRRQGGDVHAPLPVTYAEAALGGEVEVPTIDGRVRVRLPAGVCSGQRFRLTGRGVARPDGTRGDHLYRVEIVPPTGLDEQSRAALSLLAQTDPRADLPAEPL